MSAGAGHWSLVRIDNSHQLAARAGSPKLEDLEHHHEQQRRLTSDRFAGPRAPFVHPLLVRLGFGPRPMSLPVQQPQITAVPAPATCLHARPCTPSILRHDVARSPASTPRNHSTDGDTRVACCRFPVLPTFIPTSRSPLAWREHRSSSLSITSQRRSRYRCTG